MKFHPLETGAARLDGMLEDSGMFRVRYGSFPMDSELRGAKYHWKKCWDSIQPPPTHYVRNDISVTSQFSDDLEAARALMDVLGEPNMFSETSHSAMRFRYDIIHIPNSDLVVLEDVFVYLDKNVTPVWTDQHLRRRLQKPNISGI